MNRAFSMLEVVVVIVVVGILAAAVIPKFSTAREDTTIASAAEDLRTMARALELYQGVNSSYPPNASRADDAAIMSTYFKGFNPFEINSPIGGIYDYENRDKVAVLILKDGNNQFTNADALALDQYMDDGSLTTGKLRSEGDSLRYRFDGQ